MAPPLPAVDPPVPPVEVPPVPPAPPVVLPPVSPASLPLAPPAPVFIVSSTEQAVVIARNAVKNAAAVLPIIRCVSKWTRSWRDRIQFN
jgi:hypothetical protein